MKSLRFSPVYIALCLLFRAQIDNPPLPTAIFGDDEILLIAPANGSLFVYIKEKNEIDFILESKLVANCHLLSTVKGKKHEHRRGICCSRSFLG